MDILHRTAQVLEDPDKLLFFGLHVDKGVLPPVEVLKQNTSFLQEQDAMARQCFSLTTALIHTRLMSQAWHSDGWPGMLVLFASPEPSDKQRAWDQLHADYAYFKRIKENATKSAFFKRVRELSSFSTTS